MSPWSSRPEVWRHCGTAFLACCAEAAPTTLLFRSGRPRDWRRCPRARRQPLRGCPARPSRIVWANVAACPELVDGQRIALLVRCSLAIHPSRRSPHGFLSVLSHALSSAARGASTDPPLPLLRSHISKMRKPQRCDFDHNRFQADRRPTDGRNDPCHATATGEIP